MRSSLKNTTTRFTSNTSGNVLILFGLGVFILIGAAGIAVDLGRAFHVRDQLIKAADAAVLAAAKRASELEEDGKAKGEAQRLGLEAGEAVWKSNSIISFGTVPPPNIVLKRDSLGWTANLDFSGKVNTTVTAAIGYKEIPVAGSTQAKTGVGSIPYMDFYFLLDASQSMGVGATQQAMQDLASLTTHSLSPKGCVFGCHTVGTPSFASIAKDNNIPLRIDVLRDATIALIDKAEDTAQKSEQFRIGLWTFDDEQKQLTAPTDNYGTLKQDAENIKLPLHVPDEDGTKIDDAVANLTGELTKSGDGKTVNNPKKFFFLITDGFQSGVYLKIEGSSYKWQPPRNPPEGETPKYAPNTGPMSPTACNDLKAKGITVAVLHTIYFPFETSEYPRHIKPIEDHVKKNLETCASPGYYYEATEGPDIQPALEKMFEAAIGKVAGNLRITK